MTGRIPARILGLVILIPSLWWSWRLMHATGFVSPVHWGLIAPHMASTGIPTILGLIVGTGLAFRGRGGRTMLVLLAVTALQALTVTALDPDIPNAFDNTVEQARDTLEQH